jgi:hypothetical protein
MARAPVLGADEPEATREAALRDGAHARDPADESELIGGLSIVAEQPLPISPDSVDGFCFGRVAETGAGGAADLESAAAPLEGAARHGVGDARRAEA